VDRLGAFPLPVEIVPFGWQTTKALVEEMLSNVEVMGRSVDLRRNGDEPFRSDEGNSSSICACGASPTPRN
jgi:ribose 5-phosphate isomerase A